jgi:pimeloyl-ACP methyl ester carboxylesterase
MNTATPPTSRTVTVNGLAYRYLEWGGADRPVVVMLHGLRSYAHTWAPIAGALSAYRVIAPDFRGRGESAWDPDRDYHTNAYVADIEDLTAQLDLTRFAIIGHSMGGTVGYVYAARHPERVTTLIVEDIGPGSSAATPGADRVVRGLYVGDASAFPSALGVNPMITTMAWARRVSRTVLAEG